MHLISRRLLFRSYMAALREAPGAVLRRRFFQVHGELTEKPERRLVLFLSYSKMIFKYVTFKFGLYS